LIVVEVLYVAVVMPAFAASTCMNQDPVEFILLIRHWGVGALADFIVQGLAHEVLQVEGLGVLDEGADLAESIGEALEVDYEGARGLLNRVPLASLHFLLALLTEVGVLAREELRAAEVVEALLEAAVLGEV